MRKIHRLFDVDSDRERQRTAKAAKEYFDSQSAGGHASPAVTQSSAALKSLMSLFCNSLLTTNGGKTSSSTNTQVLTVLRTLVATLPPQPASVPLNSVDLYRSFFPVLRASVSGNSVTEAQQSQSVGWYFRLALAVGSLEQMCDLVYLLLTIAPAANSSGEQDFSVLLKPLTEYATPNLGGPTPPAESDLTTVPSAAIARSAAGVLVLRHLARIATPYLNPSDVRVCRCSACPRLRPIV